MNENFLQIYGRRCGGDEEVSEEERQANVLAGIQAFLAQSPEDRQEQIQNRIDEGQTLRAAVDNAAEGSPEQQAAREALGEFCCQGKRMKMAKKMFLKAYENGELEGEALDAAEQLIALRESAPEPSEDVERVCPRRGNGGNGGNGGNRPRRQRGQGPQES